jgi:coenzyme F420-reducing hydrogenase alpha subunit
VGGFYRAPRREELSDLLPELRWGRAAAEECLGWLSTLPMPSAERDYELVALVHPDEYAICEGRIVSSRGLDIDVRDYDAHFEERHVPWSNALHSQLRARGSYLCGPLSRFNLSFEKLPPAVQAAARAAGVEPPCRNPFKSLLVRMVEVMYAFDEAIRVIEGYSPPSAPFVEAPARAATGFGASEAPRGLLYHRYALDAEGTILDAKIVPPTSQNQPSIEEDLMAIAPDLAAMPHEAATRRAEQAVRNHDPCISCATHFLELRIERG